MSKIELLHQEVSVSPLTLGINHRGFHQTKKNHKYLKPMHFKDSFVVFYGHRIDWYGDMDQFKVLANKIIEDVKTDSNYGVKLLKDIDRLAKKIYELGNEILKKDLSKLSNKQLATNLDKLYQLGKDISDLGMIAVIPDLRHAILTTLLKEIVKDKINQYNINKQINYYFTPLITPTHRGLVHKEKITILKLVKKISLNRKLKQLFIKERISKLENKLINEYPLIFKEINKIYDNYKWLSFGQLGPTKTFNEYLEDIKIYLETNKYNQEYKSLIKESNILKKLHAKFNKELHLNSEEKLLFKTARNFSYNKTVRFDSLLFLFYVLDELLKEISKRVNLTVKDLRFASTEEIIKLLNNKKVINKLLIEKRRKLCITLIKGKDIEFLVGDKAKKYLKDKVGDLKIQEDKTLIHGMSAFLGKAIGTVKIVNSSKDMSKVKHGDVIVSVQTNPDLLPAMKKASAFVTDIGGITSHAAIVARELKKPCKEKLQLSQRQRMSPFPNYMSMECICKEMKDVVGYAYKEITLFFQNNNFWVFMDKQDHRRVGEGVLNRLKKEPDLFIKYAKLLKGYSKSFNKYINTYNKKSILSKLSDSKLASLHEGYEKRYKQIYSTYFPVLAMENYLFEYLRNYIFNKVSDKQKAGKYLNVLITEYSAMVNRKELVAALKLLVIISKKDKWVKLIKSNNLEGIKKDKELYKLIKAHEKNYFWLTRDYEDPVLTFEDFILRFKKHLTGNPNNKLSKLINEEKKLDSDQKRIIKKLDIDKDTARLFQTMREGMYYKELRKTIVSLSLYYFDPVLNESARRLALTVNQIRHFKMNEFRKALVGKKDYSRELSERIKLSCWQCSHTGAKVIIEKKAEDIFKKYVKIDMKAKYLTGQPVSPGKAKGPVKIVINPDSFHKVKKGDIIATLQATPVFSTIISLSVGMVCDGGPGITSHPVTLAREAGIPCIIGAKSATKILKDGDIVEVDGTNGIMNVIKRK